ncbi:MAG: TPM domain-containing protein [Acutalibacteraceae bacterium]
MKKKLSAFLFLLAFCFSLCVPVSAAGGSYIIDECNYLSESEVARLDAMADTLSAAANCDFLFVYTYDDLEEYVQRSFLGSRENQILMIENDDYWDIYTAGTASDMIDDQAVDALRGAYDEEKTYYDAVAAYLAAAANIIKPGIVSGDTSTTAPSGKDSTIILDKPTRMVDMADIFTDSEETALLALLNEVSERQQTDIVVVTVHDLNGKSREAYADDFYDYNGYGFGDNNDGVLYLLRVEADGSYEKGNSWISTCGYGITAFTDTGIQFIGEQITPALLDGNYHDAVQEFISLSDDFITQAKAGKPYDTGNLPKGDFPVGGALLVALVSGFLVALLVTRSMKRKLNTVRAKPTASEYIDRDSMRVTDSSEYFLYSHVDRRVRPKETGSGSGGSSTHTSSSGETHGGGGF